MPSRIEPGDGRIITSVKITGESLIPGVAPPEIDKELVADTGGVTMIPLGNIAALFGRTPASLGPLTETNFGPTFEVSGVTMEVEVELADGTTETRTCDNMSAHLLPDGVFLSGDGLLGMDQFDELRADPVKNAAGDRAYIRART